MQVLASGLKVPALFFLTVVVTFPSLYVFSALLGVRLGPLDTLRVVVAALAVNVTVLASLALITLFFTFCTTSYPFMKLLNFAFFAAAGLIGLGFLMSMLQRLEAAHVLTPPDLPGGETETATSQADQAAGDSEVEWETTQPPSGTPPPSLMPWPLPSEKTTARRVFRLWVVLYALVGAQMGWVLRPFVGAPDLTFEWFRERDANIFLDLLQTLGHLFDY